MASKFRRNWHHRSAPGKYAAQQIIIEQTMLELITCSTDPTTRIAECIPAPNASTSTISVVTRALVCFVCVSGDGPDCKSETRSKSDLQSGPSPETHTKQKRARVTTPDARQQKLKLTQVVKAALPLSARQPAVQRMDERKAGVKDALKKMRAMTQEGYEARQIGLKLIVPRMHN